MRFRDARSDCANPDLGYKLHSDASLRVHILQIVDKLRQIFDRVDVVMRRRRNQSDAWRRVTDTRDVLVDLMAGKLSALSGLCPLSHLDLELFRADEILAGHAEASGCHLLD